MPVSGSSDGGSVSAGAVVDGADDGADVAGADDGSSEGAAVAGAADSVTAGSVSCGSSPEAFIFTYLYCVRSDVLSQAAAVSALSPALTAAVSGISGALFIACAPPYASRTALSLTVIFPAPGP